MSSDKRGFDNGPTVGYTNSPGYPQGGSTYPPPQGNPYPQHAYGGPQQAYSTQQGAVIVTQPGAHGYVAAFPHPPDYMVPSIFACLCCFWPTGLCAIYYASQARSSANAGDFETAKRMSNSARNLMIASIVIGVIWITLVLVLRLAVYSSSSSSYSYSY